MQQKTPINDLSGGLNKDFPAHQIAPNQLSEADNIVYRQGFWNMRGGYSHPYGATANAFEILEIADYTRNDGTGRLYAADKDGIYELSGTSWNNRLNLGTTRAVTDKWWFAEIDNAVYATNGVDNIYKATTGSFSAISWDTSTDSASETGLQITRAKIVLTLNSRLWFFNTTDSLDGSVPIKAMWTEVEDFDRSEPDNQMLFDDTISPILSAGVLSNNFIAVYKQDQIVVIQNTGNPVTSVRFRYPNGILAPKAWTRIPNGHFFIGQDGFYMFSGATPSAVGELHVTSHFFDILDITNANNLYCWTDMFHREVHIHIPTDSGIPTRQLIYNWQYNNWSESDLDAWCGFYRYRTVSTPVRLYGASSGLIRLEGADAGDSTDNGTAIETSLATKAMVNAPTQDGIAKDYIQVNRVVTDALPVTATVGVGVGDFGAETPTYTSATITATDGMAPFADIAPVAGRYITIKAEDFETLSEFQIEWKDAGEN